MKSYYISDYVQIDIDDSYKWTSTLFFNNGMAGEGRNERCKGRIFLEWVKSIDKFGTRPIGDGADIGDHVYIDEKYGVRFEAISESTIHLTVEQECNEWLVIAIELLLLQQDKTLIHAAAVEKNNKALIMPSWGGVGKTAIVCRLVREHGWRLLGDDLVVIDRTHVYPFLKPFVIYPYHKNLFPELFRNGRNHTVKNLTLSKLMSKAISTVKRLLRPMPFVLAYLRRHNPQSMRVSPRSIFSAEQLSNGGEPFKMVWLDRCAQAEVIHTNISAQALASRTAAVSSVEIFAEKLNSVYHLCGCGIYDFQDAVEKIHEISLAFAQHAQTEMLQIPVAVPIESVGRIAFDILLHSDEDEIWQH